MTSFAIVMGDEFFHRPPQGRFAKEHHLIKSFPPDM